LVVQAPRFPQPGETISGFSHLGVSADMAGMTVIELWALYCFLSRLDGGAS